MTEDAIKDLAQAAIEKRWQPEENLGFLVDEVEDVVVGPEALVSIVRNGLESVRLLNLLIDRGIELHITHDVLETAAGGNFRDARSLMTCLLARSDKIMLSDELFRAAAGSGGVGIFQVLSTHCGLAEVPNKWLDLARLHDAIDSSPSGSIDYNGRPTRDTDLKLNLVEELLAKGVAPDVPDGRGQTPCMHAAGLGNILILQALLSAGANSNAKDRQGRTPLFFAAYGGHYSIVEILLDLGIPTHLKNENGDTAASIAKDNGHIRVLRLLERRRRL